MNTVVRSFTFKGSFECDITVLTRTAMVRISVSFLIFSVKSKIVAMQFEGYRREKK